MNLTRVANWMFTGGKGEKIETSPPNGFFIRQSERPGQGSTASQEAGSKRSRKEDGALGSLEAGEMQQN